MAVDIFLKLEGITGEAQDSKHKEEIDVLAWSWGMTQSGTVHLGGGAGSGKANVQDLSVTKYVDLSSAALALHCASGKHIPSGILTIRKAGDTPLEYMIYEFETLLVSSISTGGSGSEDRLTENIALNFAKVKFKYTSQAKTGAADKDNGFEFNIPTSEWS